MSVVLCSCQQLEAVSQGKHLGEVGQGAAMEAEGDALALHVLLAHARYHLHPG